MGSPLDQKTADNIEKEIDDSIDLSIHELLRKLLEAQVKGGYNRWKLVLDGMDNGRTFPVVNYFVEYQNKPNERITISFLDIILDTNGMKAAYGEKADDKQIKLCDCKTPVFFNLGLTPIWVIVSQQILQAWNSCNGNSYRAALETAVSFLPLS